MVQVGRRFDYDDDMDGNDDKQEPSWTQHVQEAIKDFVASIGDSSRQLASAAEKFAADSLRFMEELNVKAQSSATTSSEMAAAAGQAAEEAKKAAETTSQLLNEASQKIREESHQAIQQAVSEAQQTLQAELQQRVDEATARIEEAAAAGQQTVSAAQQALTEARQTAVDSGQHAGRAEQAAAEGRLAAEQINQSASRIEQVSSEARVAIESVGDYVARAEQAATEARAAVDSVSAHVSRAEQAASESRGAVEAAERHASRTEQVSTEIRAVLETAGQQAARAEQSAIDARQAALDLRMGQPAMQPSLGDAGQQILERLESDYQLLAGLVQDLHARISGLTTPAAEPTAAVTREEQPEPLEQPVADAQPPVESRHHEEAPAAPPGPPDWRNADAAASGPWPQSAEESHDSPAAREEPAAQPWNPPPWETPAPEPAAPAPASPDAWYTAAPQPAEMASEPPAGTDSEPQPWHGVREPEPPSPTTEPIPLFPQSQGEGASGQPAGAAPSEGTVAGRILVTISPVPDFDKLLNLDSALGRMQSVANVSLADYVKEEVTFRIEMETPVSADEFARSLSDSVGTHAEVASSEEGKLALRLAS